MLCFTLNVIYLHEKFNPLLYSELLEQFSNKNRGDIGRYSRQNLMTLVFTRFLFTIIDDEYRINKLVKSVYEWLGFLPTNTSK